MNKTSEQVWLIRYE